MLPNDKKFSAHFKFLLANKLLKGLNLLQCFLLFHVVVPIELQILNVIKSLTKNLFL